MSGMHVKVMLMPNDVIGGIDYWYGMSSCWVDDWQWWAGWHSPRSLHDWWLTEPQEWSLIGWERWTYKPLYRPYETYHVRPKASTCGTSHTDQLLKRVFALDGTLLSWGFDETDQLRTFEATLRAGGKDHVRLEGGKGEMQSRIPNRRGGSIANPVGKGPDCAVTDPQGTGPDSKVRCAVSKASMGGTYSPAKAKACVRDTGPYWDSDSTNLEQAGS